MPVLSGALRWLFCCQGLTLGTRTGPFAAVQASSVSRGRRGRCSRQPRYSVAAARYCCFVKDAYARSPFVRSPDQPSDPPSVRPTHRTRVRNPRPDVFAKFLRSLDSGWRTSTAERRRCCPICLLSTTRWVRRSIPARSYRKCEHRYVSADATELSVFDQNPT